MSNAVTEWAEVLSSGDVAKFLDLSRERVVQLDEVLKPQRTQKGRRVYMRAIVAAYAEKRAAEARR